MIRRLDLVLCLAIASAVLVLLAPWLVNQDLAIVSPTELGTDFITKQWPNAAYIVHNWQQWGEIPLWRRAAMAGVPIVGSPSMLLTYPLYWLIFLFPIGRAFTLYYALHLIWAGWGVYGFARSVLKLSAGAALLAALTFTLSAKIVAHIGGGHIDIIAAVAWLPWLWWAVDGLARRPSWLSVMGTATAIAAQALTHLPTAWLSALVVGCWALSIRLADRAPGALRRWRGSVLAALGALLLAIGLSLVHIGPMLELLPLSTRGGMTLSEATQHALPIPLLLGLVLPTALAFPEWVIFAGVVTLALAPVSWLTRRSTRGWYFFAALIILGLIISLGRATPLYSVLYYILPGMKWIRVPSRMIFLVQLAWAFLAGMGYEALTRIEVRRASPLVGWWITLLVLIAIGAAWTYWMPGALAIPVGIVVITTMTLVVLVGQSRLREKRPYASLLLAVLVMFESLILAPQFIAQAQVSALAQPTPLVDFLQSQTGHFRSYSPRGLISLAQAVAHEMETVDGNDPFQLDHYVRWTNAASGCTLEGYAVGVPACTSNEVDPEAYLRAQPDGTLLSIGSVRYVVTNHVLSQWTSLVWQSGPERVYENSAALPLAFVVPTVATETDDDTALQLLQTHGPTVVATVPDPLIETMVPGKVYRAAQVIHRTANRIEVQAEGPGWLVLSEVWTPGWQALVDGTPSRVYRTDVAFSGLAIPDGPHTITFRYAPTGWVWGRWISLGTVVVVALVTLVMLWKRRCGFRFGPNSR